MSLLARLIILVSLAVLPALAIQGYDQYEKRRIRSAQIHDEALRLSHVVSAELDRIAEGARLLLAALAENPDVVEGRWEACTAALGHLLAKSESYRNIVIAEPDGRVVCAARPDTVGRDARRLASFPYIMAADGFTIGVLDSGPQTGARLLTMGGLLRDPQGRVRGAAWVALSLDWLAEHFEDRFSGPAATLLVADRLSNILIRLPQPEKYVGEKLSGQYGALMTAADYGTADIVGVDGVERILGYSPFAVPPTNLYVGVGLTRSVVFAALNRETEIAAALTVLSAVLALIAAWGVGTVFVRRPVQSLLTVGWRWSAGDYAARAEVPHPQSEFGRLARAFNAMAAQLQRRQAEREATERQLRDFNEALERGIAERTAELVAANDRLAAEMEERARTEETLRQAQKMDAVGQLTGGVAHDFNNILTVIGGSLDLLQRRIAALGDAGMTRHIEAARRGVDRAASLTQRLLAFARRQPLDPRPLNLNRLITGMSDLLRRTLSETVVIETVLTPGLWTVLADANQLENAVLNLAVNARDAMPHGGKLTIETANVTFDAAYAAANPDASPGQHVMIAVTDTGSGMPPDVAARAFEPFFTTKDVGQGTGLGLSQVYGFIKQSGGHVKIYSEPGLGTAVKIYLPRLATGLAAAESEPAGAAAPAAARGETVLVVEDDEDVRAYAVELLTELGYRVLAAADSDAAMLLLGEHPEIDLLFTDVGLPGGTNGRQLADAAHVLRPDLKVLFTSGYPRNAIVHHGRLDPGVDLLGKPFTLATLGPKLRQVLDRAPARA
jgi:signal transduction histidine kinase/CheY-like chemotaxis protein